MLVLADLVLVAVGLSWAGPDEPKTRSRITCFSVARAPLTFARDLGHVVLTTFGRARSLWRREPLALPGVDRFHSIPSVAFLLFAVIRASGRGGRGDPQSGRASHVVEGDSTPATSIRSKFALTARERFATPLAPGMACKATRSD